MAVSSQAKGALRVASPWLEWLARLGYLAKAVVYGIIGVLAFQVAIGEGGQTEGTRGALREIASEPFGEILLYVVALGLLGYALWLFARSLMDTEDEGSDAKGIAKRIAYLINGAIHAFFAYYAFSLTGAGSGAGGGGGGSSSQELTAQLLSQPFGRWLVGLAGAAVIVVGLYKIYKSYAEKFREKLDMADMSNTERKWTVRAARAGLAAQGVVIGMIGVFVVQAAIRYDPSQVQGLGGALSTLARQPYGPWLLGLVALGLIAHAVYMVMLARYRHIQAV